MGSIYYFTLKPSIKPEDINIRATLKQLENPEDNYYSYLIDLIVENKSQYPLNLRDGSKYSYMIYPYIPGLGNYTIKDKNSNENKFVIGSSYSTKKLVIKELKKLGYATNVNNQDLYGFTSQKKDSFTCQIYFTKLDNISEIDNAYLFFSYTEKKFNKDLSWIKIVPLNIKK